MIYACIPVNQRLQLPPKKKMRENALAVFLTNSFLIFKGNSQSLLAKTCLIFTKSYDFGSTKVVNKRKKQKVLVKNTALGNANTPTVCSLEVVNSTIFCNLQTFRAPRSTRSKIY